TFTFVEGAEPLTAAANQSVNVTTTVTSLIPSTAVIGIDVYAPGGSTVAFEKWFHNESFGAGEQRTYPISWTIPAGATLGTYRIDVSAYAVGWKALFGAKIAAATFSVAAAQDRKSTRLNSSHLVISYAVFCLKKKKNKLTYPINPILISYNKTHNKSP